ncbi:MAG: metal ABC transporter solute-binding protein, Zn/Mn family [Anaerolineae bacterium]
MKRPHHLKVFVAATAVMAVLAAACAAPPAPSPTAAPTTALESAPATESPASTATPMRQETAPPAAKVRVVALESFIADIAQNVAGDRLKVKALMPPGLDPHAYQPTPADVAAVADSDVLIVNGAGLVPTLEELLKNAGGNHMLVEAAAGLTSREPREGEEAVMSPEERAEALCAQLPEEEEAAEPVEAGAMIESAAKLGHEHEHDHKHEGEHEHEHGLEKFALRLLGQAGDFGGYLRLEVKEDGDYLIALPAGQFTLTLAGQSKPVELEETFEVDCAGLVQAAQMDLEPGEYTLALSGFAQAESFVVFGPAGGHHHHHDSGDPHFWLDPNLVIKYVENIRDALSVADPDGAPVYAANATAYIARLKELDAWIVEQVAQLPPEARKLVTNHESFGYFADRYGFQIIGTVVPNVSPMAQPSAQQLARLADRVKEAGVRAIFLETGADKRLAQQLAQETGIKVVTELYSHSITDASGPAPTYIDMMRYNTQAIVNALRP